MRSLDFAMGFAHIKVDELNQLSNAKCIPPGEHLIGLGSAFDPPGYPSYRLSSWQMPTAPYDSIYFIVDPDGVPRELSRNEYPHNILRSLWIPVPEEEKLVQSWEAAVYCHWMTCWGDGTGKMLNASDWRFHDRTPEDDLNNYGAVIYIRQWYPDHQPLIKLIPGYKGEVKS